MGKMKNMRARLEKIAMNSSNSNSSWKLKWEDDRVDGAISNSKIEPPKENEEVINKTIPKTESQPSRSQDLKCFKCLR